MAWSSFSKLMILDNFKCPVCGVNPPVIICDGLTLSYRKKHRIEESPSSEVSDKSQLMTGCSYSNMLLIPNKTTRQQLLDAMNKEHVTEEDIGEVLNIVSEEAPFLLSIIKSFQSRQGVPTHWRRLLHDISKSSSIAGFAQCSSAELQALYEDITVQVFDCVLAKLAEVCPPLFQFFKYSSPSDRTLVKPIIENILNVLRYVESYDVHPLTKSTITEGDDTAGVFPSLPLLRNRGHYLMDSKRQSDGCRKISRHQKTLLPGIFLLHCQHGVCYGFHVMDSHESPDVPFTILLTRFEQAPKVVVYDNACNLHSYSLNRNPGFFKNTKFLVDRFHWNNHVACSSGYSVDAYPQFSLLNTQVAEQRNATLNRLKASLSYQHQEHFFQSMKLFLSFRNTLKVLKLREPKNASEILLHKLLPLYK